MSAYDRHKKLIATYLQQQEQTNAAAQSDLDIISRQHQFIRDEGADAKSTSWEVSARLSVRSWIT